MKKLNDGYETIENDDSEYVVKIPSEYEKLNGFTEKQKLGLAIYETLKGLTPTQITKIVRGWKIGKSK